jgi:hypothetical protein
MWELIHKKCVSTSTEHQLTQMRQKLLNICEKERILRERSADREVHRYLLDARRLLTQESFDQMFDIAPPQTGEGSQLAA